MKSGLMQSEWNSSPYWQENNLLLDSLLQIHQLHLNQAPDGLNDGGGGGFNGDA